MLAAASIVEGQDLEAAVDAARRRLGARLRDGSPASASPLSESEAALIDDLAFVVGRLTDRQAITRDIRALAAKYAAQALNDGRTPRP